MPLADHSLTGALAPLPQLIALRQAARVLQQPRPATARAATPGPKPSRFRGRGLDFAEVRHYQPGDDIRHIDWRVTARTGRVHTKLFQEERERPVLVVADLSASTCFGTQRRFKSVAIAELTALLLWQAHDHGDRVGAIIQGPAGEFAQRPRHSRKTLLRVLGWLSTACNKLSTDVQEGRQLAATEPLESAVLQARRAARPGTRVVLISDFSEWLQRAPTTAAVGTSVLQEQLQRLTRHGALEVIRVSDRLERSLPPAGNYPLRSGSLEHVIDSSPAPQRAFWEARFQAEDARLRELVQGVGGRLLNVGTEDDLPGKLGGWW